MRSLPILLITALVAPLAAEGLYDPIITNLSTGHALEARPMVSSDGKYVTLGDMRVQSTNLDSIFVEEIRTLTELGARSFTPRRTNILPGGWELRFDEASSGPRTRIDGDLEAKGDWRLAKLKSFIPRTRKFMGRVQTEDGFYDLEGTFDAQWHRFTGTYDQYRGDAEGTVVMERVVPPLPEALHTSWLGRLVPFKEGGPSPALHLALGSESGVLDLGEDLRLHAKVLHWNPDNRQVVLTLWEPATPEKVGYLRGSFGGTGQMLAARILLPERPGGVVNLLRTKDETAAAK